jgi:flagellar protein FlaJ
MGLIARLSVFVKRTFPEKFLFNLDRKLMSTKIALAAEEYISVTLIATIIICVVTGVLGLFIKLPLPPFLLVPLIGVGAFPLLTIGLPRYWAGSRAAELERVLPDALRQMASTLRAGVSIDGALEDIAKSKYGELSKEFDRVVSEVKRGRTLENALLALARRSNSPLYERAFHLIVEGIERGAALADVLDAVAVDIKEVHTIQRERKSSTTQPVMFLYAVALFAAPFIIGLTVGVAGIEIGEEIEAAAARRGLPPGMETIALAYTAIQAFICGLAVGIIRYGKVSKGFSYSVVFLIVSVVVFNISGILIEAMAPTPT